MSRITFEVSSEVHRRLKDLAEARGLSLEQFVIERALGSGPAPDEQEALFELRTLLEERIRTAEAGYVSKDSVIEVFEEAEREARILNANL